MLVKNDFYCLPISSMSHHNNKVWMSKPSGKSYHFDVGSHKRNVIFNNNIPQSLYRRDSSICMYASCLNIDDLHCNFRAIIHFFVHFTKVPLIKQSFDPLLLEWNYMKCSGHHHHHQFSSVECIT